MTKGIVLFGGLALAISGCCMGGGGAASAPLTLSGPGFTPSPTVASGMAGGVQQANLLDPSCVGNVPIAPQHTVTVGAAIPLLRVLVNAGTSADTTLVVRTPSGSYICNDDSGDPGNGLNPAVDIPNAAPGEYAVYVGGYGSDDTFSSYSIGFTETPGVLGSQVVPH